MTCLPKADPSPTELAARIRAALRKRETPEPTEPYTLGELTIDYTQRSVTLAGRPVPLTAIEYRTLVELPTNPGRVLTYQHLLLRVWGHEHANDLRPMRTAISSLRRKLQDNSNNPTYIHTEHRVGYRMPNPDLSPKAKQDLNQRPQGYEPNQPRFCQAEARMVKPSQVLSGHVKLVQSLVQEQCLNRQHKVGQLGPYAEWTARRPGQGCRACNRHRARGPVRCHVEKHKPRLDLVCVEAGGPGSAASL